MPRTRKRYTEPEIINILQDRENNRLSVRTICLKYGITSSTFYRWRNRHQKAQGQVDGSWDPAAPSVSATQRSATESTQFAATGLPHSRTLT